MKLKPFIFWKYDKIFAKPIQLDNFVIWQVFVFENVIVNYIDRMFLSDRIFKMFNQMYSMTVGNKITWMSGKEELCGEN